MAVVVQNRSLRPPPPLPGSEMIKISYANLADCQQEGFQRSYQIPARHYVLTSSRCL